MHWLLVHAGWYSGHWYNLLSSAFADVLLLALGAISTRLLAWHRKHAADAAATRRILASLHKHLTGRDHPDAP